MAPPAADLPPPALPHFHRLFWVAGGLLALVAVLLGIDRLALRHLNVDAERSAIELADHLLRAAPEVVPAMAGGQPIKLSAQAHGALGALQGIAGLFHFQAYDVRGQALLLPDTVAAGPATLPWGALTGAITEHDTHADTPTPAAALSGVPQLALKHGNGLTLPLVYSVAYVPVQRGDQVVGVVSVYLDQTERADLTAASFRGAALLASGALMASFALGATLWRRRLLAERANVEKLNYLAEHDSLTGTLNLASFRRRAQAACDQPGGAPDTPAAGEADGLALLVVDVDHFKDVNDHHGQAVGDRLLAQVADRLRSVLRGSDCLGRLGGDRFAVLQTGVAGSEDVKALTERILRALAQPYALGDVTVQVTASLGAAIHGVDGLDAENLSQHAEVALLRARAAGRGTYSFYDPALDAALQRRRQLALDLAQALAEGGLQLHYQPLFASGSGALLGYEALARWQHPLHGPISPGEFIPLAEECGLICALGQWVLNSACRQAAGWPGSLSVAVNLSAAQFSDGPGLVQEVRQAMQAARLPAQRLELEITESLLMSDTDQVLGTLRELKALGVKIGMDDFGTGFSSLAYLWRFPFDKLKIDRAFTQGLERDAKAELIVQSIVSLAHALGMRVNAEGVETEAQRRALQRHGCDELQGFLLGRPQPTGKLAHEASAQTYPEAVT